MDNVKMEIHYDLKNPLHLSCNWSGQNSKKLYSLADRMIDIIDDN